MRSSAMSPAVPSGAPGVRGGSGRCPLAPGWKTYRPLLMGTGTAPDSTTPSSATFILKSQVADALCLRSPRGAMLMEFTAGAWDLNPIPDGHGGLFYQETWDLTIDQATGIYAPYKGGHNHMVTAMIPSAVAHPAIQSAQRMKAAIASSALGVGCRCGGRCQRIDVSFKLRKRRGLTSSPGRSESAQLLTRCPLPTRNERFPEPRGTAARACRGVGIGLPALISFGRDSRFEMPAFLDESPFLNPRSLQRPHTASSGRSLASSKPASMNPPSASHALGRRRSPRQRSGPPCVSRQRPPAAMAPL